MRIYKKIYSIKYEKILLMLFVPLAIIQFIKANIDYKLISILMSIMFYGGICLMVETGRKEILEKIKQGIYEPIFDIYMIIEYRKELVRRIDKFKKDIKKEVITSATNINDQIYIEANVK